MATARTGWIPPWSGYGGCTLTAVPAPASCTTILRYSCPETHLTPAVRAWAGAGRAPRRAHCVPRSLAAARCALLLAVRQDAAHDSPAVEADGVAHPRRPRRPGVVSHYDKSEPRFSPSLPENGLHTRPPGPEGLQPIFPHITLEQTYTSTYFPIRSGESIPQFRERMEVFLPAWISRVEAEMPHVKTAVLMSHAATVIGLGRAVGGEGSAYPSLLATTPTM